MVASCVVLPVKAFRNAKTRLRSVLTRSECATVARLMAFDMLDVLSSVPGVARILLVGQGDDHAKLAKMYHCDYRGDEPALGISGNLDRIVRRHVGPDEGAVLYVPSDLAFAGPEDVARLLAMQQPGVTICRALRDGGTNALLASLPGWPSFAFGAGSAQAHARLARAANRQVRIIDEIAFQRDIDVPEDLAYCCRHGRAGNLHDYLRDSGIKSRIESLMPETRVS